MKETIASWLDARALGYATTIALVAFSGWNFIPLQAFEALDPSFFSSLTPLRSAAFVATFFLGGFFALAFPAPGSSTRILVGSSTIMLGIGYVVVYFSSSTGSSSDVLFQAAMILIGSGTSLSFLSLPTLMAHESFPNACRQILFGSAAMFVLYMPVSIISSMSLQGVAVLGIVAANALCLFRASRLTQNSKRATYLYSSYRFRVILKRLTNSLWRPILSIAVVGYASSTSRGLAEYNSLVDINVILSICMPLSALLLATLMRVWKYKPLYGRIYLVTLIAVATAYAGISITGSWYYPILAGICYFAFSLMSMLMMLTSIQAAADQKVSATGVFGLFSGLVYLLSSVGTTITTSFGEAVEYSQTLVIALSCIYLLSFVGLIINLIGVHKRTNETRSDSQAQTDHQLDGPRDTKDTTNVSGENESNQQVIYVDVVPLCCERLKDRYKLSNRETEVLEYIIRGRSARYISDALYVTQGTIQTHTKNLYKKLGVPGKQQLLDLFEEERNVLAKSIFPLST